VASSTDDGVTWTVADHSRVAGSPPMFDAGSGIVRPVGNVLATDGSFLYAASYGGGLQRWSLSNASLSSGWTPVLACSGTSPSALCSDPLQSVVLDSNGNTYVADTTGSVYEIVGVGSSNPGIQAVTGSGPVPVARQLAEVGGHLYAAAANGIFRWVPQTGQWVTIDESANWFTITGSSASGKDHLIAGQSQAVAPAVPMIESLSEPAASPAPCGSPSVGCTNLTAGHVDCDMYGSTDTWWECGPAGHPSAMMGGFTYQAGTVALDGAHGGVMVAGRSGVWHYDPSTLTLQPAVKGLNTTYDQAVSTDPAQSANVAVSDADWNVVTSTTALGSVNPIAGPFWGQNSDGTSVTWDTSVSPSALIAAGGDQTDAFGGRLSYDPYWSTRSSQWSSIDLPTAVCTASGCARPLAITASPVSTSAQTYTLLVAFQGHGVWECAGHGSACTWGQIAGGPPISGSDIGGVRWAAAGGNRAWLYDESSGLWSYQCPSTPEPCTWAQYTDPQLQPAGIGWVVADPALPGVWLSNSNGLFYVKTSGCTPTTCRAVNVSSNVGPLAVGPAGRNQTYVYQAVGTGGTDSAPAPAEVLRSPAVDHTGPWSAVTCTGACTGPDAFYQQAAFAPVDLAVANGGHTLIVAQAGGGVITGTT
jgi:hypothetical protein